MKFSIFVHSNNDPFEAIYMEVEPLERPLSLFKAMELAADGAADDGYSFTFAARYNDWYTNDFQLIMLNDSWNNDLAQPAPNLWSVVVNGAPLQEGLKGYKVQPKDVIVFTYGNSFAPPLDVVAERHGRNGRDK